MTDKQMELGLPPQGVPRKRLMRPWEVGPSSAAAMADVGAMVRQAVGALNRDTEARIGMTGWREGRPPISGYWEVDMMPGFWPFPVDDGLRLWYDAEAGFWRERQHGAALAIESSNRSVKWRGLQAPWPDGYTYRVPGLRTIMLGRPE